MPYFYIAAAIVLRLLPHPWNVTPLGAMFLFSGATVSNKGLSLLAPLLAVLISDFVVVQFIYHGAYSWFSPFTWLAFIAVGAIGWTLRNKVTGLRVLGASLAGSIVFFAISNFGTWAQGNLYPHTAAGLLECYVAAIPFFRNSLLGDLFYAAVMFGSYYWLTAAKRSAVKSNA